jgi:hypothetical protein
MSNVLIILLHRPFVSDGHLHPKSPSVALDAFSRCSGAALAIDQVIQSYEQSFCLERMPYIISYATYVSATIHVRLASQRHRGSDAHKALRRCLDVLDVQQHVCWSPRRAKTVISALMARTGVVLDYPEVDFDGSNPKSLDIDIDAIMQTFGREQLPPDARIAPMRSNLDGSGIGLVANIGSALQQGNMSVNENNALTTHMVPSAGIYDTLLYDPIFGFNGSTFDDLDLMLEGELL